MRSVEDIVSTPMSGKALQKYVPANKIILFEELKDKKLQDVLPNETDFIIILFENVDDLNGHWVALLKYPEGSKHYIEFFDSYGNTPAQVYNSNTKRRNKELEQDRNYLSIMIKKFLSKNPKYVFIYNEKKYQKLDQSIATCGRWVIFRILTLIFRKFSLQEFQEQFAKLKSISRNESNDAIVSLLVR